MAQPVVVALVCSTLVFIHFGIYVTSVNPISVSDKAINISDNFGLSGQLIVKSVGSLF